MRLDLVGDELDQIDSIWGRTRWGRTRHVAKPAATLTPLFLAWKIKFGLEIQPNPWGNDRILYHKTSKESSTVLCSVVKHLGSGRALKKWGKHSTSSRVFPYTSFVLYHFLSALQQNRAQSRLLYLLSWTIVYKADISRLITFKNWKTNQQEMKSIVVSLYFIIMSYV